MKILVVNAFYPPLTTGSAHFSHDVARQYRAQGHEVLVVTARPDGAPLSEVIDGVPIVRVDTKWVEPGRLSFNYSIPVVARFGAVRRLRRIFDDFGPDIVHQNGQFFDLTLLSSIVAWRRSTPRVLTIHTPLTHTSPAIRGVISAIDRTVLRVFARLGTSRIFAVDRFTMEMAQRRYGPTDHPVAFIPATLDPDVFGSGDADRVRRTFGLEHKKVILSFGHVIPIRSRKPLIRALPRLLESVPNTVVVVVGHVYDSEFLRIATSLGVRDHVIVVGRVPHAEVPDFLASADVECHELDGHGIGITTFEVMSAGVPVVACAPSDTFPGIDLDAWPHLQLRGEADPGLLADRLVQMLTSDEASLDATVQQQRKFIDEHFSAPVVASRYLEVFAEMTSAPAPRPSAAPSTGVTS